jgi:hypothetical protein
MRDEIAEHRESLCWQSAPCNQNDCEVAGITVRLTRLLVAESAALARVSKSRKQVSWPETAFEELRISPHEEIPEGTQHDFAGPK